MKQAVNRREIAKQIQKIIQENPPDPCDMRPISGNIGQNIIGYLTDKYGRLIPIKPVHKGVEWVGPGSYTPEPMGSSSKRFSINVQKRKSVFRPHKNVPGPADYTIKQIKRKILPVIPQVHPDINPPTMLSGDLEPKPWVSSGPKTFSRNRHPQISAKRRDATSQFLSKANRELFPPPEINLSPGEHFQIPHSPMYTDIDRSSMFKNRLERFREAVSPNPSPCAYTIPNDIGSGPKFSLCPQMDPMDPEPIEAEPGPGDYDTKPHCKKLPPHAVFASSLSREMKIEQRAPPVGSYEIAGPVLESPPIHILTTAKIPSSEWSMIPLRDTPSPYKVDMVVEGKKGNPPMCGAARSASAARKTKDRGFVSQHSNFIKRTYNSRYDHVNLLLDS